MDFFNGFSWAIPTAFSDAVATCQFEEGDVLYDTKKAYGDDWDEAKKNIHYHIQVRKPARGQLATKEISGSIFNKNWNAEVFFELVSRRENVTSQHIRTTQGRLYSTLWRGDLSFLDSKQPNPKKPLQLREVNKKLDETITFAKELAGSNPVFINVRDLSNIISRTKHLSVKSILHYNFCAANHTFNADKTGIRDSNLISPTIDIVFYVMEKGEAQQRKLKKELSDIKNQWGRKLYNGIE